jgi:hypothetical protein
MSVLNSGFPAKKCIMQNKPNLVGAKKSNVLCCVFYNGAIGRKINFHMVGKN